MALRIAKVTGILVLALAVVAALSFFWLRHEFARVQEEDRAAFDWGNVAVKSVAVKSVAVKSVAVDTVAVETAATPCNEQYPLKRAWFGGLHVHTSASYDATSFGSLVTVADAYRFARGEPVNVGLRGDPADYEAPVVRISSPLDFMAVTDHAEALAETRLCYNRDAQAYGALVCKLYRGDWRVPVQDRLQPIMRLFSFALFGNARSARLCGTDGGRCIDEAQTAWRESQRTTEQFNDSSNDCEFSAFHGYEYTLAEASSNLHRNVIFAGDVVPQAALSAKDAPQPDALWQWLTDICIDGHPDCDAIAIPHNSNWSAGRMWVPPSSEAVSREEQQRLAALRARVEPLVEIMQVKGDSECRNGIPSVIGAPDELCDFEKLRKPSEQTQDCGDSVGSGGMLLSGCVSRRSYVRYALAEGLRERETLGINPFQMGIIAATDTHNGTPTAGLEKGHSGSHGTDREPGYRLLGEVDVPGGVAKGSPVRYNPGGIAGVFAHENRRQALFDAMRSRETFGTSGPRIVPRFFGGWSYRENLCAQANFLAEAYAQGVPMGADLPPQPAADAAPVFVASAVRDPRPQGHQLQRLQIIKGWIDDDGMTNQAVYDIAGDAHNGATVDRASCAVSGPGADQLCTVWRDPDFEPGRSAVYYLRVLENPSCRWSHYDCLTMPAQERPPSCSDPDLPWQIQERAWTSPIWYQPAT